ncbi:MAG: class I SAM-dependent methyltransferase [Streptosporangiaceae bacterium]|nr:class I SAM-dependent methyltransferase [Streptosporangiaceae bacterium]
MSDVHEIKAQQRAGWDAVSAGWDTALETFERGAMSATRRLLELGGVREGQTVLDLGTGVGEPALTAATLVGPSGRVVGLDFSSSMLAIARRRGAALSNVEFVEGDLEYVDFPERSFDVVLSRWGLMFAVDRSSMFERLRKIIVPGGVLAAAVWGPASSVPMLQLGFEPLVARLELPPPPPGAPGPFSMSDGDQVAHELKAAHFSEVSVTEFTVPFRVASMQEYADMTKALTPPSIKNMIKERFGSVDDPATWKAVGETVAPYAKNGEISLPSTALCIRAVA